LFRLVQQKISQNLVHWKKNGSISSFVRDERKRFC